MHNVWPLLARNDRLRYFAKLNKLNIAGVARSRAELDRLISEHSAFDWYLTLNPTRARACPPKARSRDVIEWAWVLLDFDPMREDASPPDALQYTLDSEHLWDYTAVIDSGRGMQAWVSLRPMSLEGQVSRSQIERAVSAWLRALNHFRGGCRIDTSCSDLARVARCPGTVNHKTGRVARILSLPTDQLDPQRILDHMPKGEELPNHRGQGAPEDSLSRLLPSLTETASRFLVEGHVSPGRHTSCYAAARSLCEAGIPLDRALALTLRGGELSQPPLPIRDIVRATKAAYEKGPNGTQV